VQLVIARKPSLDYKKTCCEALRMCYPKATDYSVAFFCFIACSSFTGLNNACVDFLLNILLPRYQATLHDRLWPDPPDFTLSLWFFGITTGLGRGEPRIPLRCIQATDATYHCSLDGYRPAATRTLTPPARLESGVGRWRSCMGWESRMGRRSRMRWLATRPRFFVTTGFLAIAVTFRRHHRAWPRRTPDSATLHPGYRCNIPL